MRILIFIAAWMLGLASCSSRQVPDDVLEPEKMEAVVWDMIQAGEFLNGFVLFRDTFFNNVQESRRWYDKVYELHQISQEDFIRSYEYYKNHPKLMKRVFDSLAVYEDKSYLATDSAAQRPAVDTFGQKQPPAVEVNINPSTEKVLTVDTAMLNKRRKQRNLQAQ
jgi:hypothetical protein